MENPSEDWLERVADLDLERVAVSANLVDPSTGHLETVEGLGRKLDAALRDAVILGRLQLVAVASGQEGIPRDLPKENTNLLRIVPVGTLSDLVDLLYEEDGPRARVLQSVCESTQQVDLIDRRVELLPEDDNFQVFQTPPLLREQSSDDLQRLSKDLSQAPSAAEIATLDPALIDLRVSEFLASHGVKVVPPPEPAVSAWHEVQLTPAPPLDPNAVSPDDMFAESEGLPRVVLGSPGGGKSTLLNYMAQSAASGRLRCRGRRLLPVTARLAQWHEYTSDIVLKSGKSSSVIKQNFKDSVNLLPRYLHSVYPEVKASQWKRFLKRGDVLLLFDGLDEVNDPDGRFVTEVLRPTVRQYYNKSPVVITCRTAAFDFHLYRAVLHGFPVYRLSGLEGNEIFAYAKAYARIVEDDAGRLVEGLERVMAIPTLRALAGNPLLLSVLCFVLAERTGDAPPLSVRGQLYNYAVNKLLERPRILPFPLPWEVEAARRPLLEQASLTLFGQQAGQEKVIPLAHSSMVAAFRKAAEQLRIAAEADIGPQVLEDAIGRGLIQRLDRKPREPHYFYPHLQLHEYLAGCALVSEPDFVDRLFDRVASPRWREVILMALGQVALAADRNESQFHQTVDDLLSYNDPFGPLLPRAALLLVAALPDLTRLEPELFDRIATRLLDVYADRDRISYFPELARQVEEAVKRLSDSDHGERILPLLVQNLAAADTDPPRGMSVARLIRSIRLYNSDTVAALLNAVPFDSPDWGWPIDAALRDIAADDRASGMLDHAVPFRLMENEPEVWKRLHSDPRWLRVVIALFGGFNARLAEEVEEAVKLVERVKEENQKLQNRPTEEVSQEERDSLSAAVGKAEERLKTVRGSRHYLRPRFFHRPSTLAERLWREFRAESRWSEVISGIVEEIENSDDASTRRDGWLVLAVAGLPLPLLLEQGGTPEDLKIALARIDAELTQVVESAFLESFSESHVLAKVPRERLSDLIEAVATVTGRYTRQRPFTLGVGRQTPPAEAEEETSHPASDSQTDYLSLEAEMTSEFWQRILTSKSDDPIYNMCVVLDTVGKGLARTPELLARSLAKAHAASNARYGLPYGWPLDPLAPQVGGKSLPVIVGAALDSLAAIPDMYDFVRSWALVQLSPLIREAGLLPEALLLAYSTLSDQFGAFQDAWRALVTEGEQSDVEGPLWVAELQSLLLRFPTTGDPLAFARYSERFSMLFAEQPTASAQIQVLAAIATVADPTVRGWLCERVALRSEANWRLSSLSAAWEAAQVVPWDDADNRTRALLRLALLEPGRAEEMLADHLRELDQQLLAFDLSHPWLRVEALATLREYVLGRPALVPLFKAAVEKLPSDSDRLTAQGFTSHLIIEETSEFPVAMAVLGVAAVAHDVRHTLDLPEDLDSVWFALPTERKSRALARLHEQSRPDGIRLTRAASAALAQLAGAGDWETVRTVLPWARTPDLAAGSLLAGWVAHEDATVRAYATLLMAELNGFSGESIAGLAELLRSKDYLTRSRAALTLYGNELHQAAGLRASRLGLKTIEMMSRLMSEAYDRMEPQIGHAFVIAQSRVVFDRPDVILRLAEASHGADEAADIALTALCFAQNFSGSAWTVLVKLLGEDTTHYRLRRALLRIVCNVAFGERLTDSRWEELLPSLKRIDANTLSDERYHPDGCAAVAAAAAATWNAHRGHLPERSQVAAEASRHYLGSRRSLADILRPLNDPDGFLDDTVRRELAEAGSVWYYGAELDRQKANAADQIETRPELLKVLVPWLVDALQGPIVPLSDGRRYDPLQNDLLVTIGEAVVRLPGEFREIAQTFRVLPERLRRAAERTDLLTGRQAAFRLFAVLGRLDHEVMAAYKAVLRDTVPAQAVAAETLARYREIDTGFVPTILGILRDDPCPTTRYLAGRMLATVARNVFLRAEVRDSIINGLRDVLLTAEIRQDVHLLTEQSDRGNSVIYRLDYLGRLDRLLYREMLDLSGVDLSIRGVDAGSRRDG